MNPNLKRSAIWIWLTLGGLIAAAAGYVFLIDPWLQRRGQRERVQGLIPDVAAAMEELERCVLGGEVAPPAWRDVLLQRMYGTSGFFADTIACHEEFRARAEEAAERFAASGNENAEILVEMLSARKFDDTGEAWSLPIDSLRGLCDRLHEQHNRLADLAEFAGQSGVRRIEADCSFDLPELARHEVQLPAVPREAGRVRREAWVEGDTLYTKAEYFLRDPEDRWVEIGASSDGSQWSRELVHHAWDVAREGRAIWGVGRLPEEPRPRVLIWNAESEELEPGAALPIPRFPGPSFALRTVGDVRAFVDAPSHDRYAAFRIPEKGLGPLSVTEFARDKPYDESWGFYVADDGTVGAVGAVARGQDAVFESARSPAAGEIASSERSYEGRRARLRACSTGRRQWAVVGDDAVLTTTDGGATWTEVHRFDPLLRVEKTLCRGDALVLIGKLAGGVAHRESICRPDGCTASNPFTQIESKWVAAGWTREAPTFLVMFEREELGAVLLRDESADGTPAAADYFRRHRDTDDLFTLGEPPASVWHIGGAWLLLRPDDGIDWL